jgi:hypothetical protein
MHVMYFGRVHRFSVFLPHLHLLHGPPFTAMTLVFLFCFVLFCSVLFSPFSVLF